MNVLHDERYGSTRDDRRNDLEAFELDVWRLPDVINASIWLFYHVLTHSEGC